MKYLIIGVSAAGMSAVKTILEKDPQGEITVVSKDDCPYSRMMMYRLLAGEMDKKGIFFEKEDFLENKGVRWYRGREAVDGDARAKTIRLDDGTELSYDKLLLATGAYAVIPPIPGLREAKNAHPFRDLPDEEALNRYCGQNVKAVIVGGGLVGLDAAYAFCKRGIPVAVVEMMDHIMGLQLDFDTAKEYQKLFEDAGAEFYLGRKVEKVVLDCDFADSVELDNGVSIPCDVIVAAAGVRPNIALAEKLGLEVNRGITVNDKMETSIPDVYAAGDVTGLSGVWQNAMAQGKVAGANMSGVEAAYENQFAQRNMFNYFGEMAVSLGNVNAPDTQILIQHEGKSTIKVFHRDGIVLGAILQRDIMKASLWQKIIEEKISIVPYEADLFHINL